MVENSLNLNNEFAQNDIDHLTTEELKKFIITLQEERKELSVFVEEMALMRQNQKAGDIEWFMPINKFTGVYRTMAEGVNEQVGDHIGVKKRIVEVIRHFGDGDFSVEMEDLPGKKAFITHDVNQFRDRILDLFKTIHTLTIASSEGKLTTRADVSNFKGDWGKLISGINKILDEILIPISEGNRILAQISDGKIDEQIVQTYQGDHEKMKVAVNNVAFVLQDLQKELARLTQASNQGQLSERGKPELFKGAYADIIKGTNQILDEILIPIGEGNRILAQISDGKIDEQIVQTYQGDHEKMKVAVNNVAFVLQDLQKELARLTDASNQGQLSERGKPELFKGAYADIIKGTNQMLDAILLPIGEGNRVLEQIRGGNLREKVEITCHGDHEKMKDAINGVHTWLSELIQYVTKIANGDLTADMGIASDKDQIHEHLIRLRENIKALVIDVNMLAKAAVEGKLATRADATKHQGDFNKIVTGVNDTLDAVINPLSVAANYVDRISKGDIPIKITDSYNGDFNVIKNNLNTCIDAVNLLVADANMLAKAAVEGKLATRADATKHQGDFNKIVTGVNDTLDAVINPLSVAANYVDRISKGDIPIKITDSYNGDFNVIKNNLNTCIDAVNLLVADANMLAKAAVEGKLATRADATKHQGDFNKIVTGVNDTLDAGINPLSVAANYVDYISKGNIPVKITDPYNGDFNVIKNNLNTCIDAVNLLVADANMLAKAAVEGKLATRADATKHHGDFRKIVKGVNDTLDSVIVPVNEALRVSQQYANYQFKARVDPSLDVNGDWVEFKKALDNIGIQISGAVGLINNQLADLSSNTEEANANVEEVAGGAQLVAQITNGVSKNAEVGYDGISQVLKAMEDLNTTVGEVSRRAEQVSTIAVQANEFSKGGIDLAKKSELSMTEITRSSSEVDLIVKEINGQMEEIGKIVRLISDIANQTNLLALNAAIEAARAGDAGRGFAVVAAEVKSLAQDSRKSAENIADMITTLQDKAQKATLAMAHSREVVAEGSKSLNETLGAFDKIATSIEDITRNAMDVASASEEQAASVEEVTASINEVSSLIVNTSKEAGEAAAATDEAARSIDQISNVVNNVSGIVESISREMSKFVV